MSVLRKELNKGKGDGGIYFSQLLPPPRRDTRAPCRGSQQHLVSRLVLEHDAVGVITAETAWFHATNLGTRNFLFRSQT